MTTAPIAPDIAKLKAFKAWQVLAKARTDAVGRGLELAFSTARPDRIAVIQARLRELADIDRERRAARRRFRMAAFLKWIELAKARQRRNGKL
jgi:hypothetical protein